MARLINLKLLADFFNKIGPRQRRGRGIGELSCGAQKHTPSKEAIAIMD